VEKVKRNKSLEASKYIEILSVNKEFLISMMVSLYNMQNFTYFLKLAFVIILLLGFDNDRRCHV